MDGLHDGFSFDSGLIARYSLPLPIGKRGELNPDDA